MSGPPFGKVGQSALQWLKRLSVVHVKEAKLTVGIDVGSSAVKIVILGPRRAMGGRSLLGQRVVPIVDSAELKISDLLRETLASLQLPVKSVALSVSGQWVIMRVVEMTAMSETELTQALPFEAQRYLPFNVQDVILDGVVLGPTSEGNKIWVLIVACKRDLLERRIDWAREAGLDPVVVDVDALALTNAFLEQGESNRRSGTHALVNVGSQWTNLVVMKDGVPFLVRDIPWGSDKFVRNVAEQIGGDAAKVVAVLKQDMPPEATITEAMKVTCEALVSDLQLSFDFFESRFGPPPEQLLVSGGLAVAPSFVEALKTHVSQPVTAWTPAQGLSSQFVVAYGLALRTASE